MEVQKHFPGDGDSIIKKIQEQSYPDFIELLYTRPRLKYLADVKASGSQDGQLFDVAEDKLFHAVKDKTTFDHDILLPAYDRIAAWFRFNNTDVWQTSLFPSSRFTPSDSASRLETLEQEWAEFYRGECLAIAERDETAKAVLNAVGFAGKDRGEDAVQALLWLLDKKYTSLTNARERWGQFQEIREFCDW